VACAPEPSRPRTRTVDTGGCARRQPQVRLPAHVDVRAAEKRPPHPTRRRLRSRVLADPSRPSVPLLDLV